MRARPMRHLLTGALVLACFAAAGCQSAGTGSAHDSSLADPRSVARHPPAPLSPAGPVATEPTVGEGRCPGGGTDSFNETVALHHQVQGYADRASVVVGQPVHLYVSTVASTYRVRAFRMGGYPHGDACQVWLSPVLAGQHQSGRSITWATRTVSADWRPTVTVDTTGWAAGVYLFRLEASDGEQWFVPVTLRSEHPPQHPVVFLDAVTTWQAYNGWGGYSLYHGPDGRFADRARAVSFDRPYANGGGSGDFLGNELPLLALAERLGLPLAYATDVDLHADPGLLDGARAVLSAGHDEYYSPAMRAHLRAARDAGTNLAFFGANAVFRRIRLAATPTGPDRLEVNYKVGSEDPLYGVDNARVTANWPAAPDPSPESALTGAMYSCNPVQADMVVADAASWLFAGTGVADGTHLPGLVGSEYDHVDLRDPTPRPMEVLTHSPVYCRGHDDHADSTYYTTPSGAGVFDAATSSWVCAIDDACLHGRGDPAAAAVVRAVTTTLLRAFAAGPAGAAHPARDNVGSVTGR